MKLDKDTIHRIEHALSLVQFGEVILVVHEGELQGIDVKSRRRIGVDKNGHDEIYSR